MKVGISTVVSGSLFAVLIAAVPAFAQERTSWLSNPFEIASGIESLPMQGSGTTIQSVTIVTPSRFSVAGGSARSHWGASYQPEFEFRFGAGNQNIWNHSADVTFNHLFSRRTRFDVGDSFVTSSDPARTFTNNIFVMPQGNFLENAGAMTFGHESSSRTTMNSRFDTTITKMSGLAETNTPFLNQKGIAGTAGISQRFGRYHKITLSYSALKFRFESFGNSAQIAGSLPTIQAGIERYAQALAVSVSRSSPGPIGLATVGSDPGATPAPAPPSNQPSDSTIPLLGIVTPVISDVASASAACAPADNGCSSLTNLPMLEHPIHVLSTTYTFARNPGWLFEVSGGAMRDREMSYLLGVQLERRFDRIWFGGQYQRFLSFFAVAPFQGTPLEANISIPDGVRPRSLFSDVTARVGGKIDRKTQLEISVSLSNGTADYVVYDLKSAIGRARISHEFTDKWTLFALVESFNENLRDVGTTRFSRQRYVGGIEVRFSQGPSSVPKTRN